MEKGKYGVVAFDETSFWDEKYKNACGRIFAVYFYCLEDSTYCCESTGSYTLIPIDFFCENKISDKLHDEMCHAMDANDINYCQCSTVDSMPDTLDSFTVKHSAEFDDYEEAFDFYRGNLMVG